MVSALGDVGGECVRDVKVLDQACFVVVTEVRDP